MTLQYDFRTGPISYYHAESRAEDRYGVKLTTTDIVGLIHQITIGESFYVAQQHNKSAQHVVYFNGITMLVVYSSEWKAIVTVLPFPKGFKKAYGIDTFYSTYNEWLEAKRKADQRRRNHTLD